MREIVKAHGAAWIARKAAELGYQIPSTISREEVPIFNFWLKKYEESPIEKFVYSFFQSEQFKAPEAMPEEYRPMFMKEMDQRKWFEDHLADFLKEMDQAIDFIAEHLSDRKNIKRCLKSLPAYCFEQIKSYAEMAVEDGLEDAGAQICGLRCLVFRNEWENMKKLEDAGYIIIREDDFDDEEVSKLYETFTEISEGRMPELEKDEEENSSLTIDTFFYFVHAQMMIPKVFLETVMNLMTRREEKRMRDQQMIRDVMGIVNQFFVIVPLQNILKIVRSIQKAEGEPESDYMDETTLIKGISKLKSSRVEEIKGVVYGVSAEAYREYLSFRRDHGEMSIQDYQKEIETNEELYNTIYEYLSLERMKDESPAEWDIGTYRAFPKIGFLVMKGPYLRLYALLAVILMEEYSMDSMFTNMINSAAIDEKENPFHRENESVEAYLQLAYDIVDRVGATMLEDASMSAVIEVLSESVGVWGLSKETQEKLLELLRQCYQRTPHPDFWGNYPDEGTRLVEDFDFNDAASVNEEEADDGI